MSYPIDRVHAALRLPRKWSYAALLRDIKNWIRIEFLGASMSIGILAALQEPKTSDELAVELGLAETELLNAFLELGASIRELRCRAGQWSLRGFRARALADPALEGIRGMVDEAVSYDADVYRALRRRLQGEPPGDYLTVSGDTVARASQLAEVILSPLLRAVVRRQQPSQVLDVGCGLGIYLREIVRASATARVVGIELHPSVVNAARRNLVQWQIADRANVLQADIRRIPESLNGPWDLVLLLQNVYYFHPDERPALFAQLRNLAPRGTVVVATAVAGVGDALAAHLDIVLRSTKGNYQLPKSLEVREALAEAGFTNIAEHRLAPRQPLRAFVAS